MLDVLLSELTWESLLSGLFLKFVIAVLFLFVTLIFKPIRVRILKFLKRITGRTKHSIIVSGNIYPNYARMTKEHRFPFEIELPYKDISDKAMPIAESDQLIYNAVNQKYGTKFYASEYHMNPVNVKKIES